jgi:mannosyltransferase
VARLDRVWVVAYPGLLAGRRRPASPVERAELAVLRRDFSGRKEIRRGGLTVRLYVRDSLSGPVSRPRSALSGPPRPGRS